MILSVITLSLARGLRSVFGFAEMLAGAWTDALELRRELSRRHPVTE